MVDGAVVGYTTDVREVRCRFCRQSDANVVSIVVPGLKIRRGRVPAIKASHHPECLAAAEAQEARAAAAENEELRRTLLATIPSPHPEKG